jgi:formylglycine-generating enzyme required for sulfatase activity
MKFTSLLTVFLMISPFLGRAAGPVPGAAWIIADLNLTLVPIAAGRFTMGPGNAFGNPRPNLEFSPETRVTLTRPFWLGRTEVTQAQWQMVMGTSIRQQWEKPNGETSMRARAPSRGPHRDLDGVGPDYPMYCVTWEEAMEFCRRLTERERATGRLREGFAYTLPTEAQWEYACRAGTTGDHAGTLDELAWYKENSGSPAPIAHPVGQKQPNTWGLYDMHGNVPEWCLDWHGIYPGGEVTDPVLEMYNPERSVRGGGWFDGAEAVRSTHRANMLYDWRWLRAARPVGAVGIGFRIALGASASANHGAPSAPRPPESHPKQK